MYDRDIVAAIVAGDPSGLAAAYDSYAARLHAYCRTLLAEPADAADAVQDTFVIAAAKLAGLRDQDLLRPWLYAVARNECHRRLRDRARQADLGEAGEMTDPGPDAGRQAEQEELRSLLLAAIAGLNPGEREIIELHLRHDLDGADLADVLGVGVNQAHALASRARRQLERSLGVVLVARTGRRQCGELDALLAGWDGRLTILLRKRVSRHIEDCATCGARKDRELSPAMLLSILPLVALPPSLRQPVLRLASEAGGDAAGYRDRVADRAEPFGSSGFPVQIAPAPQDAPAHRTGGPGGSAGRGDPDGRGDPGGWGVLAGMRARAIVFSAAGLVILLAVGSTAAYLLLGGTAHLTAAAHGAASASPVVTTGPPTPSGSDPTAARSAPPSPRPSSASATASAPGVPAPPARTAPPSPPPRSSPPPATPRPTPSRPVPSPRPSAPTTSPPPPVRPGTLEETPGTVQLAQSQAGGPYSGTFTLTAVGGPVTFAVDVPPGESFLSVSPASGELSAGQAQTVTVASTPSPDGSPPPEAGVLTVNPGDTTVTVLYSPPA
jgi:RNA polymerase sigma factor (sigma-70 family)